MDANPHGTAPGARGWVAPMAAVGAGLGASLCCVGPVIFATLGVGAGIGSRFEPLRPYFTVLAVMALAIGFFAAYRPLPAPACEPGEACALPRSRRRARAVLWGAAVMAAALWSFTYWSVVLL